MVLNPLNPTDPNIMSDTDLAGPLVFCLLFGGMLLLVSATGVVILYSITSQERYILATFMGWDCWGVSQCSSCSI